MPSDSDLALIFRSILAGHLRTFTPDVQKLADVITDASIKVSIAHRILTWTFY